MNRRNDLNHVFFVAIEISCDFPFLEKKLKIFKQRKCFDFIFILSEQNAVSCIEFDKNAIIDLF